MKETFCLFFILLLAPGCEINKIKEFEFPRINTLEVVNIDENGATFSLEIESLGEHPFDSMGFVWNLTNNPFAPELYESEYTTIAVEPEVGVYNSRVNSLILENVQYQVRAFVRTSHQLVYGNSINFISKGSAGPEIISVFPESGVPGDTIFITGNGFSIFTWENDVFLDSEEVKTIQSHHNHLKFTIPKGISPGTKKLKIMVYDREVNQELSFTIIDP